MASVHRVQRFRRSRAPPKQAEAIVAALRQRAVPVTELTFPGEGHGLRRTGSIHRALEAELTFYRTVLNRRS